MRRRFLFLILLGVLFFSANTNVSADGSPPFVGGLHQVASPVSGTATPCDPNGGDPFQFHTPLVFAYPTVMWKGQVLTDYGYGYQIYQGDTDSHGCWHTLEFFEDEAGNIWARQRDYCRDGSTDESWYVINTP